MLNSLELDLLVMALGSRSAFRLLAALCLLSLLSLFACKPIEPEVYVETLGEQSVEPLSLEAIKINDIQIQNDELIVLGEGFSEAIDAVTLHDGVTEHTLQIVDRQTDQLLLRLAQGASLLVGGLVDLVISSASAESQVYAVELTLPGLVLTHSYRC